MPHPNSQGGLPAGGSASSKSVLDQQDELKHWPDDRLIAEMQNPSGVAPQYLLFTEINRREDVRSRYEAANAAPNTTMAEELVASKTAPVQPPMPQQPGMGPMPPGGGPMPPPDMGPVDPMSMGGMPPQGMPPGPPMMPPMDGGIPMPPGPQGFAYGGLVTQLGQGGEAAEASRAPYRAAQDARYSRLVPGADPKFRAPLKDYGNLLSGMGSEYGGDSNIPLRSPYKRKSKPKADSKVEPRAKREEFSFGGAPDFDSDKGAYDTGYDQRSIRRSRRQQGRPPPWCSAGILWGEVSW